MCSIAMPTQANDDAWRRSLQYAYHTTTTSQQTAPPQLAVSSSAFPAPSMLPHQPSYSAMYHHQQQQQHSYQAAPQQYYPPAQASQYDVYDAVNGVYALPARTAPTSYSDMLALSISDDLDDVRILQEMLLTPHTVDDEAKEAHSMMMFQSFSRPLPLSRPLAAPSPAAARSQPSTPHSEVSSCDSHHHRPASHPRSPPSARPVTQSRGRSQRKIPTSRICRVLGCNKGIRSRGLCKAHGGGRRCQTPGCTISDQGGGHCIAHGGGKRCTVGGCDKSAQFKGLCKVHGGSRRCRIEDCDKNGQIKGLCRQHYTQSVQEHGDDDEGHADL